MPHPGNGNARHRFWRPALSVSVLTLTGLLALLYLICPLYLDPVQQPFTGAQWYNPYATTTASPGRWFDANFHAHARAWSGLTNGSAVPTAVDSAYRARGYAVVGISDYHRDPVAQPAGVFPVYEHGMNAAKSHALVIGGSTASWLDFPLGQSRHQRQFVLDRLHASAPLVAIAHPGLRDPADQSMLPRLTGFDLLEVFNHFIPPADSIWDAVLSAGHPVWLLASDDSHNLTDPGQIGVNRTRIFAVDSSPAAIIAALREGRAVGVHHEGAVPIRLESLAMQGDTLTVVLSGAVTAIRVIGAHGTVVASQRWDRPRVASTQPTPPVSLTAVPATGEPYLRVVAEGPNGALLYTNPVVRWNGISLPHQDAMVDRTRTFVWRLGWSLTGVWMVAMLGWRRQRRPRTLSA